MNLTPANQVEPLEENPPPATDASVAGGLGPASRPAARRWARPAVLQPVPRPLLDPFLFRVADRHAASDRGTVPMGRPALDPVLDTISERTWEEALLPPLLP